MNIILRKFRKRLSSLRARERKFPSSNASVNDKLWAWKHGYSSGMSEMLGLNDSNLSDFLDPESYENGHPYNAVYSRLIDSKAFLPLFLPADNVCDVYVVYQKGRIYYSNTAPVNETLDYMKEYTSDNQMLFSRPLDSNNRQQVKIISRDNFNHSVEEIVNRKKSVLITEKVAQHDYSSAVFPESVNTIRIILMRCPQDSQIFTAVAFHRFGTSASVPVDNVSSGGVFCPIVHETGQLYPCYQFGKLYSGWKETHPDTGKKFEEVVIPGWYDIKSRILKIFNDISWFYFGGLDVVITKNGFKILEINSLPECCSAQLIQPYFRSEKITRFFASKGVTAKR